MKRVTLTVDAGSYAAIDKLVHKNDVSASWTIRRSMLEFLERHQIEARPEIPLDQGAG